MDVISLTKKNRNKKVSLKRTWDKYSEYIDSIKLKTKQRNH